MAYFTYSPEEDTPAASMPDQIPEEVKEERQAELMELQQDIVFDQAEDRIGERAACDDRRQGGQMRMPMGKNLPGCAECRRTYFCEHIGRTDVGRFCKGKSDRISRL